jgi:hypothetical protein
MALERGKVMEHGNAMRTGRWIGAAILATFVIGMVSNFKLQTDLFAGDGLLVNAAAHPLKIGLIAVLGLATNLALLAVAAALTAHVGRAYPVHATTYCLLVGAGLAIAAVEYSTLLAFRTVSEQFASAGAPPDTAYQVAKKLLSGLRNGVHFLHVTLGGASVFAFFALLYRARLVPSALALFGIAAALVQMFAVGRPLFGLDVIYPLLAPLALAYVATAVWLLVKGLPERR